MHAERTGTTSNNDLSLPENMLLLRADPLSPGFDAFVVVADTAGRLVDSAPQTEAPLRQLKRLEDLQLPFTWTITDPDVWNQMLSRLMPHPRGRWPKSTCTRLVKDAKLQESYLVDGPFKGNRVRHITLPEEIHALVPHIKWNSLTSCLDPMSGTNAISAVLRSLKSTRHVRVITNDWDETMQADMHDDALQPRSWMRWSVDRAIDAVITSPYFGFLDLVVPLMFLFVPILIVHVPSTWLFSATPQRRYWLQEQYDAGRLHVISNLPRGAPGPWRCCWVVLTHDSDLMKAVVVKPDGLSF